MGYTWLYISYVGYINLRIQLDAIGIMLLVIPAVTEYSIIVTQVIVVRFPLVSLMASISCDIYQLNQGISWYHFAGAATMDANSLAALSAAQLKQGRHYVHSPKHAVDEVAGPLGLASVM